MISTIFFASVIVAEGRFTTDDDDVGRHLSGEQQVCKEPVAKARVIFPDSIGGRSQYIQSLKDQLEQHNATAVNGEEHGGMWSGYVNITKEDWLFYWFFENKKPMPPIIGADGQLTEQTPYNRPLIIWSNGGPGCSAMEGATTENGPLRLLDMKKGSEELTTKQLTDNWSSWNQYANVIYVDQPRYVGFSFGHGPKIASSKDAGKDMVTFINGWMDLFPQYKQSDIFLASESYGGHYVPAWADAINDYNEQEAQTPNSNSGGQQRRKRLRGSTKRNTDESPLAYRRRISADATQHRETRENRENDKIRLRGLIIGNGAVNETVQNQDTYEDFLIQAHLLPDDYTKTSTPAAVEHDSTATAASRIYAAKRNFDAQVSAHIGYEPNYYDYRLKSESCDACVSYNYTDWANWFTLPEVKNALNVCGNAGANAFEGRAAGCVSLPGFDQGTEFDFSGALARSLEKGIDVIMYYGKQDRACDFVGGYKVANTLEWSGKETFANKALSPLVVAGQEMGQWKSHGGLTFVQVEDAGHMVPLDQPAAGAWIANKILKTNVRDSF